MQHCAGHWLVHWYWQGAGQGTGGGGGGGGGGGVQHVVGQAGSQDGGLQLLGHGLDGAVMNDNSIIRSLLMVLLSISTFLSRILKFLPIFLLMAGHGNFKQKKDHFYAERLQYNGHKMAIA